MKGIKIITLLLLFFGYVNAQTDTITTRDTIEFRYLIKTSIIQDYNDILNTIAFSETNQNEVMGIIDKKVKGSKENKLFYSEKVIIENDLNPGADKNNAIRGDVDVVQYLLNFHTTYAKADEPTIFFSIKKVSPLKKGEYFFYNVLFESNFGGKTTTDKKYDIFDRVAEIILVKDANKWRLYIQAIRFPVADDKDFATENIYTNIVATNTDLDRIIKSLNDEKELQAREEKKKQEKLILEGDDAFEDKNYDKAISKYRDVRLMNPKSKEALEKLEKVRVVVAQNKQKQKEEAERKKHIEFLNNEVVKNMSNFNFKTAKVLCDSLTKDFAQTDVQIVKLSERLSAINSILVGVESALDRKNFKDAIKKCEENIKINKKKNDSLFLAELHYRLANVYIISDPNEKNDVFENLKLSIEYSNGKHQEALYARADKFVQNKQITDAFVDAMRIIENDSRNPEHYIFAAQIYVKDSLQSSSLDKAIEMFGKAIYYKTKNKWACLEKAKLEYNKNRFDDVIKTVTLGISENFENSMIYFYRGMSYYKTAFNFNGGTSFFKPELMALAGNDFRDAIKKHGGIAAKYASEINSLSVSHSKNGISFYNTGTLSGSVLEFTKSILIDSSEIALYKRAETYLRIGGNDEKALADLVALLKINPTYVNALALKGLAFINLKDYINASKCFVLEEKLHPENFQSSFYRGLSEFNQQKYADAILSYEASAKINPSDTTFYYAALSAYMSKNYDKAIVNCSKSKKEGGKSARLFHLNGKAFFAKENYSKAIDEFEMSKRINRNNESVMFDCALAYEMNTDYEKAILNYDLVKSFETITDSANFRSAISLIKSRKLEAYSDAITKINSYIKLKSPNKSEAYSYLAYANLFSGSLAAADECIEKAKSDNENNAMLHYVMACKFASSNSETDAISHLEKAFEIGTFVKKEVENEKYFKTLKKNPQFKSILAKKFSS